MKNKNLKYFSGLLNKKDDVTCEKNIFSNEDYNSNDGMITYIWGPALWHVLHTISFNYPVNPTNKNILDYYKFLKNLKNILPCKYCRDNLKKNFKILPLTKEVFENRYSFSKYIYDLHELINKMLNKKSNLTYNDVRNRYENFRSRCIDSNNKLIENGCVEPLYKGERSKCILTVVPRNKIISSFTIDRKCLLSNLDKN
jgi:hypothetical protein